ncbi:box C/D snoRNA protein 1-like [Macadamia integrifolia]|uniref:box C/D snoRNA protein 1-like n=1 Tax=Macadamia integrifolia TaxID=60698 RepID=UPI001C4F3211|nr:box C/D snoRNA protein 1-like [Macadamia integrifolia]
MEEQQESVVPPNTDHDHSKQASLCEECSLNPSKYRCPGCSFRSCSLPCVKAHKQRTGCTGKRLRTQFVPLSQFDDNLLISDYNFLEEAKKAAESAQRMRRGKFGSFHFKLPFKLRMLRNAAGRRKTRLLLLPEGMSKREKNQSRYDQKKDSIFWTIEWRFRSADVILIDHGVDENTNLCSIIEKHLQPGPWNHQLMPFCREFENLRFFIIKNPKGPKSHFHQLDMKAPLRQQLADIIVIEYPVVHIFLPSDGPDFEIIKDAKAIPQKLENRLSPNDERSPKGVLFREEEIEDDGISDPQILDLLEYMNSEPLDNLQVVNGRTDGEVISSGSQLAEVSRDLTPSLKNESQMCRGDKVTLSSSLKGIGIGENMGFDFDQDLKDVYSGLMEQANPDGFLDLEGGSIKEGFPEGIRESIDFSGVFSLEDELEEGEILGGLRNGHLSSPS